MNKAKIYRPDKNAMQSGTAKMRHWLLEFIPHSPLYIEGLMGWSGSRDTTRQIHLTFPTQEAAIAYAKEKNIPYELLKPQPRKQKHKAYADNFKAFKPK